MNETALRAALDACLVTDAVFAAGPAAWVKLPDPFPDFSAHDGEEADDGADNAD